MSIYLENYVESTLALPSELTRLLNTIGTLDDRSAGLSRSIREQVEECLALPPPSWKGLTEQSPEVAELRQNITADQRRLIQFGDEKMALACIAVDLVDLHMQQLDKDLASLQYELEDVLAEEAAVQDAYYAADAVGRKSTRGRWDSLDGDRDMKDVKRRRISDPDVVGRIGAGGTPDMRASPAPSAVAGEYGTPARSQRPHLRREKMDPVPSLEPTSRRRASAAAIVHDAAAALADEDDMADLFQDAMPVEDGPTGTYMPEIPEGFQLSARTPQGGGRLLTKGDIGPNLCNQLMELFWPDDNCWYLVEIRSIDSKQIKAAITYVTGETEELDLEEIIREGHMQTIVRRT